MVARRASLQTAREADLVLLVLDAVETTPEDEEFIRILRPFSDKILLVVNKVDTPDRDTAGVERARPRLSPASSASPPRTAGASTG